MTTGEKIRAARQKAGLTQKQLGEMCGIAEPTIRRYELDKLNPKKETLQKIATPLEIYYLDLYGDEESKDIVAYIREGMKLGLNAQVAEQQRDFLEPFRKQGYEFTESERQAVVLFNQLKGMTQQAVITDLARLCLNPRHRKDDKPGIVDDGPQDTPQSPPAPTEGTDTTPPADAPETPPEGE